MDNIQKKVLHKKTFFLTECLQLTDNFLKEAARQGLVSQADMLIIEAQRDEQSRMIEFINTIARYKGPGFDKLCYLLERTSFGDLADELKAEVILETEKEIQLYIYKECESILETPLNRTLKGRRILNKDEILKITVNRFAAGKEIGILQAKRRIAEINKEKLSILDDIEKVEKVLDNILALYGATAEEILRKTTGSQRSLRSPMYYGPQGPVISYKQKLTQLENKAKSITGAYHDMVDDHREFIKERAQCFYLLGFGQNSKPTREMLKMKLDRELQNVLASSSIELDKRRLDIVSKEDMAKTLDLEVNSLRLEMDRQIKYKQRENEILQKKMQERDIEVIELKKILDDKQRLQRIQQTKIEELMKRCQMLENTRRMGYFSEQINSPGQRQDVLEHNRDLFEEQYQRALQQGSRHGSPAGSPRVMSPSSSRSGSGRSRRSRSDEPVNNLRSPSSQHLAPNDFARYSVRHDSHSPSPSSNSPSPAHGRPRTPVRYLNPDHTEAINPNNRKYIKTFDGIGAQ